MRERIGIVDYGVGNMRSITRAVMTCSDHVTIADTPAKLKQCDRIILPGVGAFSACMQQLIACGMRDALLARIGHVPVLGICVGMQILFSRGLEHGIHAGLGVIDGDVTALTVMPGFSMTRKVPNIGWRSVQHNEHMLFADIPNKSHFYFVHGYAVADTTGATIATTEYDVVFAAAVAHGVTLGTQFHPEKSADGGLRLLHNFCTQDFACES